jgi:hypothetical protein
VGVVSDPKTLLAMAEAQIALCMSTLVMLREALNEPPRVSPPMPVPTTPERCAGIEACALKDGDAKQSRASFGSPHAWRCTGCGHHGDASGLM